MSLLMNVFFKISTIAQHKFSFGRKIAHHFTYQVFSQRTTISIGKQQ